MRNWKQVAAGLAPDIPDADLARIAPNVEALDAALRPLLDQIPHETEPAYVMLVAAARSESDDEGKSNV